MASSAENLEFCRTQAQMYKDRVEVLEAQMIEAGIRPYAVPASAWADAQAKIEQRRKARMEAAGYA